MNVSADNIEREQRPADQPSPSWSTLLRCFLRTYLVGAAFNTRGMQNIGLIYAMEPGLKTIYADFRVRQLARKRYLRHYNTHMFWTPLLVGIFLSLEDKIARGFFPAHILDSVKNTTTYTLSAIGDSVFTGSLLVFWSLTTMAMILTGYPAAALIWSGAWFLALQCFKLGTFIIGYREGLKFILRLKRWDLINLGVRLKMLNAVLLAMILYLVWPQAEPGGGWALCVAGLGLGAWLIARGILPRELVILALLAVIVGLPLFRPEEWIPFSP